MTSIQCKAVQIIPDYDYEHINKLTMLYMGIKEYPYKKKNEKRITVRIKPERVFVMPEIHNSSGWFHIFLNSNLEIYYMEYVQHFWISTISSSVIIWYVQLILKGNKKIKFRDFNA